jgi:hypothetical protein
LFEVRRRGERVAMHRVTRHALWAAATVVVAHALMAAGTMIRRQGVDFFVIDYVLVTVLTGSILFLLGRMFEKVPEAAFAPAVAEDDANEFWVETSRTLAWAGALRELYVHGPVRRNLPLQAYRHAALFEHW